MEDTLKLVGRSSNEIFLLRYPSSLLDFCGFDLSYFAKSAIEACSEAQKTGKINPDVFAQLRRDIQNAHCYIEHNIRTTYEKVAIDCWIDYLCRRDNIGTGTLWNRYISCRTQFDKLVFSRLCEFRYNRAINEWLNIVRVQDYAKSKIDFVFTKNVKNAKEAASRRNYFDLMFSVTAQEMGCRLEDLGEIKVFSVGRTPSSPFMFSAISKDIVRHVLADFDYSDDYSDIGDYREISDQIAMDAFAKMRAGLPAELSSYNIVRGKMENYTEKIYMPCSLKAVVDLEIDAIIESGGILCPCKRCGRLYLRNADYDEDYCRTYLTNGKTCLEIYRDEHPVQRLSPQLDEKCARVTDEIYARVGTSMSTKEYENWHSYMSAMREKVDSGEISPEELNSFLDYSLNVDISRSKPIVEVPKREERPSRERVVKPFVPERISRSEIAPQKPEPKKPKEEEELPKDGFFTSPTVFRRKNEGQQISHIIRAGEPRGDSGYTKNPNPRDFQPFVQQSPEFSERRFDEENQIRAEVPEAPEMPVFSGDFVPFSTTGENAFTEDFPTNISDFAESKADFEQQAEFSEKAEDVPEKPAEVHEQKPKIIRKNAAAISAYGKMSGAAVTTAPPEMDLFSPKSDDVIPQSVPEETPTYRAVEPNLPDERDFPDDEPFRDIGSIFDVLEQSESDLSGKPRKNRYPEESEPSPEWEKNPRESLPKEVTKENAPSGIWTEERNLFVNDPQSELDMLKEKKHAKSNKTRRLYDVIMREPDDNPNFRRKN
ncbi:MAG: hypothetical protein J6C38_01370 [Oscillospiraceae bacterium]|nr:hypothetical protein [Oscillospiraceae bacterium]